MINAFKYTKQLEEAGFSREQAEIQLQMITEIVEGDLATKQDLNTSVGILKQDLNTSVGKLEQDLNMSVERLEHKMLQMEYRLIIKIGSIITVALGIMTALIKLL